MIQAKPTTVLMATRKGVIKKTDIMEFSKPRSGGKIAVNLAEGDELIAARLTDGTRNVFLCSLFGKSIRFHEADVRPAGGHLARLGVVQVMRSLRKVVHDVIIHRVVRPYQERRAHLEGLLQTSIWLAACSKWDGKKAAEPKFPLAK